MKKYIIILMAIVITLSGCVAYSLPPPEFDPMLDGEGIRVLLIDDFDGEYKDHGNKTSWALYDAYPFADLECVDYREAKSFYWQEEFDLIIVMPWFDTEREVKQYVPDRILEAETMKIAPAGNADPPYTHDNALDEWFVLVGANGHEDWCQGEIRWNEGDVKGTCGATVEFAKALINEMIKERMENERLAKD